MIQGNRVRLRPVQASDLPRFHAWFDNPDVMRHWATPALPVTEEQFAADLRGRFARFDDAGYFVIDVPGLGPIGRVEFEALDHQARSAEVMILIGEPSAWGQGYGGDAMVALLRYLFHARNLHRVALAVLTWNERAIRLYRKLGFVAEGTLRDDVFYDRRYHDQIVMSILRPEFDARWPPPT
jgi:RimJ/RimL family protein N-acetyltransferase